MLRGERWGNSKKTSNKVSQGYGNQNVPRLVLSVITFAQGNLLEADAEAVVNAVNTVGIMGKGIALMFKERFPENFKAYEKACENQEVRIGKNVRQRKQGILWSEVDCQFPH